MKQINIGLIGFGTVGRGVYNLLKQNSEIISARTGLELKIKTICDLRLDHVIHTIGEESVKTTGRWEDLVKDDGHDIIIELIGGIEPAKSIILSALGKGKCVVTANKKLLAEEGDDIFSFPNSKSMLGFEASVGGGMPCVMALKNGLVGNRIQSVMGILNGTSNFILSKMEEEQISFKDALRDAQQKGFAESDPTFDIEGFDTGHKIALLSMLAFNKKMDFRSIPIEGITKINTMDIAYARDMGYTIKLLGIAKTLGAQIDIRVHPTMIPRRHPLASVRNEFNAVMFDCDSAGHITIFGKGAGAYPTASAVVSDLVWLAEKPFSDQKPLVSMEPARFIRAGDLITRYYLRIHTEDRPGILSRISGALGKFNISIASVIQKEVGERYVPLIFMTHEAGEEDMRNAVREIENFEFIQGNVVLIRVEDSIKAGESR